MIRLAATGMAIAGMLAAGMPRALTPSPGIPIGRYCSPDHRSPPAPGRAPDRDCPDACHAVCSRGLRHECEEE